MPLPVTFGTLPAGNEAATQLDTNFNAVAALGNIPCTCTGTNALALTPNTNTPTISSLPDLSPAFIFVAPNTSNGTVTINVNGLGARNAYKYGASVFNALSPPNVVSGDIVQGGIYRAIPLQALNGGLGGFLVDQVGAMSYAQSNSLVALEYVVDNAGVTITTGVKGFMYIPFECQILFWSIIADQSGSIAFDIWRANSAVPNSGNSIVGSGTKPNLTSAQLATPGVPVGWTSVILQVNDYLAFDVPSAPTSVTRVTLILDLIKL